MQVGGHLSRPCALRNAASTHVASHRQAVITNGERRSANRTRWATADVSGDGAVPPLAAASPEDVRQLVLSAAADLAPQFAEVDAVTLQNAGRVQQAMRRQQVGPHHFAGSTGYGHGDLGREAFDAVLAELMGTEACMARIQIIGPGHALACALLGTMRPGDRLLVANGPPSSHLAALLDAQRPGSLADWGVASSVLPTDGDGLVCSETLERAIAELQPSVVLLQRAAAVTPADCAAAAEPGGGGPPRDGGGLRRSLSIGEIGALAAAVRRAAPGACVVVDNLGGELLETREPGHVGADLVTGSLTGHVGGAVATEGGYVAGRAQLVERACARLSAPGLSLDAGSVPGDTQRLLFQGLFLAPGTVGEVAKSSILISHLLRRLGFDVLGGCAPAPTASEADGGARGRDAAPSAVTTVCLGSEAAVRALLDAVQAASCIGAFRSYRQLTVGGRAVVVAGGGFIASSNLEMSALAVLEDPWMVHLCGGTHWGQWANVLAAVLPRLQALAPSAED